ncbi:hypothetical protein [Flavobacterium sp.]|uniref:hypothetical protein n=1 Tax=Flavobacterium sp. TaxID=239 RepID=UPI00374FFBCF
METVLFKSNSKKDMNLLVTLAKKIGVEVQKINSTETEIDENSPEYELKVEQNLGKIMDECRNSPSVSYEEVQKVLNKWK